MKKFLKFLRESDHRDIVVIYPGRFQPAHRNHAAVYNKIKQALPTAVVYISTTNDVKASSPFTFEERKIMLVAAGIPEHVIIQCKNPYVANEIKSLHNLSNTVILFAVGAKDMAPEAPRFSIGLKKDGTPTYMQICQPPFIANIRDSITNLSTADKHSYVCIVPTLSFNIHVGTKILNIKGATQIRDLYKEASEATRRSIVTQLYGSFNNTIYNIFNNKLT